jgi:hypothetical protein
MTNESEPESKSLGLRPSLPEEQDPIKSLSIDRAPEQRANIWAAVDIARKYLYTNKEGYYDTRDYWNMLDGLHEKVFPGLSNVQIKDFLQGNGWPRPIVIPNTNDDPNDKEDFRWYVALRDGTVDRPLTKREEYAKSCREAKEREDPIERYCYDIRGIEPWYNITYDEKERFQARREEERTKNSELTEQQQEDQEFQRILDVLYRTEKPEGITDKEWAAKKREARKLRREIKKESDDDFELKYHGSATGILNDRVNKLHYMCYCTGRDIRNGKVCKICKLAKKADEYLVSLFKDAAEGRASSNITRGS